MPTSGSPRLPFPISKGFEVNSGLIFAKVLNMNLLELKEKYMSSKIERKIEREEQSIQERTGKESIAPEAGLRINRPKTIHIIPQAHIDLIWYWSPEEAVRMILKTFRRHAEILEKNPDYTYAQSQAAAYEIVLREDPALFERVRKLVEKNQWELVGGEWVEADTVLPGPEARIRQFLVGQTFFKKHFKRTCSVGWSPDAFIMHPGSLPQILRQAGIKYFIHKRPREKFAHLPVLPYYWRGFDGSKVLTYRTDNKGNGLPSLSEGTHAPSNKGDLAIIAELFEQAGLNHLWGSMGVGDIGGVNSYAIPETSSLFILRYSTPSSFFAALESEIRLDTIPVLEGSSPLIMTGALTTRNLTKKLNRMTEKALVQAEFLLALGQSLGISFQGDDLANSWKRLLFLQFHDSLAGCGTEDIFEIVEHDYREIVAQVRTVQNRLMRQIAESATINFSDAIPVIVFNSLGHRQDVVVESRVTLPEYFLDQVPFGDKESFTHTIDCKQFSTADTQIEAVDESGNSLPVMFKTYTQIQKKFTAKVRFLAKDLPPFGYKTFYLRKKAPKKRQINQSNFSIDTDSIRVEFNYKQGGIDHIKYTNHPHLAFKAYNNPLGQLRIHHSGSYQLDYGLEQRAWMTGFSGKEEILKPVRHQVVSYSGIRTGILFDYTYGKSTIRQEFLLEPDTDFIEVTLRGDWKETEKYLKVHFAFSSDEKTIGFADLAYGFTESLPEGKEHPMQFFCGLRDQEKSLVVLNNSCYGCMFKDRSLSISAIRCATYPAHISDEGPFELSYRIMAADVADVNWVGQVLKKAFAFNWSPLTYAPEYSSQERPSAESLIQQGFENVLASCLKPAQDGNGLVVRLFNPHNSGRQQILELPEVAHGWKQTTILEEDLDDKNPHGATLSFNPYEIKTIRFLL